MIDRTDVQRLSLLAMPVAALAALMLLPTAGPAWALCFGLSAAWGAANFFLLTLVLDAMVRQRRPGVAAWLLPVKLVFLFGGLWLLASLPQFAVIPFLVGMHTPFALIALEAVRRQALLQIRTGGVTR